MATAAAPQSSFRCLIVDDLPIHRKGLERVVENTCKECKCIGICDCAENGLQAVGLCKQNNYDLITVDYNMEPINGAETTRRILALNPHNFIVGFTTNEVRHEIEDCLKAGMRRVLPKDWKQVGKFVKEFIRENFLCSALKKTSLS